jgi:hypothetical protein
LKNRFSNLSLYRLVDFLPTGAQAQLNIRPDELQTYPQIKEA